MEVLYKGEEGGIILVEFEIVERDVYYISASIVTCI